METGLANKEPYRAILSTILHGDEPGAERLAFVVAKAAESLPAADRDMWLELIGLSLNEISRKTQEAMMNIHTK